MSQSANWLPEWKGPGTQFNPKDWVALEPMKVKTCVPPRADVRVLSPYHLPGTVLTSYKCVVAFTLLGNSLNSVLLLFPFCRGTN